jgi:hypothetical protein
MLWVSVSIAFLNLGFVLEHNLDLRDGVEHGGVAWSLAPRAQPISVSEVWISWRAKSIGICRGKAASVRFFAPMSLSLTPKSSATLRWMCSITDR